MSEFRGGFADKMIRLARCLVAFAHGIPLDGPYYYYGMTTQGGRYPSPTRSGEGSGPASQSPSSPARPRPLHRPPPCRSDIPPYTENNRFTPTSPPTQSQAFRMAASSPWIHETTAQTFQQDVLERSREVPVVIDFWAPWCGPCRMLGPVLEQLTEEHEGQFILVKANTDELPEIAAGFGVESIPAVFAMREGRLVDKFVGVMPEPQIRAWLRNILPSPSETLATEAATLEETDPAAAESAYRQILQASPSDLSARIGLARALLAQDRIDEAEPIIDELASADALDAQGQRIQAQIVLRRAAQELGDPQQWRTAAEADPRNLELGWKLAQALAAAGQYEEAMQAGLSLVQRDRKGLGEQARQLMVHLFHFLGTDDELVSQYRRKLAMALY